MIPQRGRICPDVLDGEHGENCRDRAEIELFAVVSTVFERGKPELNLVNELFFCHCSVDLGLIFRSPQSFCGVGYGLKRPILYEI